MKKSIWFAVPLLALLVSACEHKPDLNQFNWLLGEWELAGKDTNTYEFWEPISDTLYEGYNFIIHDQDTNIKEHLWLESREGKVIFSAKVYGHNENKRIFFDLDLTNMKVARFVNHNHDFPTVIEYHKTGKNYLEVLVRNEEKELPPIVMQRIDVDGNFVE